MSQTKNIPIYVNTAKRVMYTVYGVIRFKIVVRGLRSRKFDDSPEIQFEYSEHNDMTFMEIGKKVNWAIPEYKYLFGVRKKRMWKLQIFCFMQNGQM